MVSPTPTHQSKQAAPSFVVFAFATHSQLNAPLLFYRVCHYRYREIISNEGDREVGSQIYRYMAILATVRSVGAFENGWELLQTLYPGHKAIAYLKSNYISRKKKWALAYRDPNDETTNNIVEVRDLFNRWMRVPERAFSLPFVSRALLCVLVLVRMSCVDSRTTTSSSDYSSSRRRAAASITCCVSSKST